MDYLLRNTCTCRTAAEYLTRVDACAEMAHMPTTRRRACSSQFCQCEPTLLHAKTAAFFGLGVCPTSAPHTHFVRQIAVTCVASECTLKATIWLQDGGNTFSPKRISHLQTLNLLCSLNFCVLCKTSTTHKMIPVHSSLRHNCNRL